MNDKKISPLEVLVAAHNETPAVKVTPKSRFSEAPVAFIEDVIDTSSDQPISIANSNFTFNFHMNLDDSAVERAFEKSAEIAKNIATMGAAFLGTAMLFGQSKKFNKVKIPVAPKTKVPKL